MIEELQKVLEENPEDWELRLVLADCYEENGDLSTADCLRWMGNNKRRALECSSSSFAWYKEGAYLPDYDPKSNLPSILIEQVWSDRIDRGAWYVTRRLSEEALYEAWRKCGGVYE